MSYDKIIKFWFEEITPKEWFIKDEVLDQKMRDRFQGLHIHAAHCELFPWRQSPEGRLAEVILLDQFSRNMYRGTRRAFAYDSMALILAQEAVRAGDDLKLPLQMRKFFYMPYMHSESQTIHELAVQLFSVPGLEDHLEYEFLHKKIIDRFGRYPHRNQILGRPSTPEEIEFLKTPQSGF